LRVKRPPSTPKGNPLDGSVRQVEEYILQTVRKPDSIEYVKWFPVKPYKGGHYVRCQYRTDGGSFGTILEDKVFFMNTQGKVIRTAPGMKAKLEDAASTGELLQ